jgi:hypothetical protein
MGFREDNFETIRRAVDPEVLQLLTYQVQQYRNWCFMATNTSKENTFAFKDCMVENSFTMNSILFQKVNGAFIFEGLLQVLHPLIQKTVGVELLPAYACARYYYPGAVMAKHKDRQSCEYSATMCVDRKGDSWPIWVTTKEGKNLPIYQKPGDMLVYKGTEVPHWREKYVEGSEQLQVFLHFVDANGPFKEYAYDGRSSLGSAHMSS